MDIILDRDEYKSSHTIASKTVLVFCVTCDNQNGFIKLRVLGYNFLGLFFCFSKIWYSVTTSLLEFVEVETYMLLALLSTLTKLRTFVKNGGFLMHVPGLGIQELDMQKRD